MSNPARSWSLIRIAMASWNFSRKRTSSMQVSSGRPHILTSHQRGRGKEPVVVLGRIKLAVAVNMASSGRRDYTSQQSNVLWNLGATTCEPAGVANELGSAGVRRQSGQCKASYGR